MADNDQPEDVDLDRTDRLPILPGTRIDDDVEDDAVRLEHAPHRVTKNDFPRASGVVLRPPAESDMARDGEAGAVARAAALTAEIVNLKAALEARDQELAQAQLRLSERSQARTQLESELQSAQVRTDALAATLNEALESCATLEARVSAGAAELAETRRALHESKLAASSFLEQLRTRERRHGVDLNKVRESDVPRGAAQQGGELQAERDRLLRRVAELEAVLLAHDESLAVLSTAERAREQALAQVVLLQNEARTREEERAMLLAQIREARRPVQTPDVGRAAPAPEYSAELVRLDGEHRGTHPLTRRTRIGRAPGCELQINSSSVSRHHALVITGQREVIIEDLNSTNGVLVNSRKISRQKLNDGDLLTIGDAQFRLSLRPPPAVLDAGTLA